LLTFKKKVGMQSDTPLTELLSNIDLEQYCQKLKIPLICVVAKDQLKIKKPQLGCYIINLENAGQGQGTHWTSFIIFPETVVYFDPFGVVPPINVISFAKRFSKKMKFIYSSDKIQDLQSEYCGWFNLFFLHFMTQKKRIRNNLRKGMLLNQHNALYDLQYESENDNILKRLVKTIFKM
jgi:hypothetical protein